MSVSDVPPRDEGRSQLPSDEISLRELYLILRRRSPWIVLAAAVVALATFWYLSTRPASYLAEVTTVVARAPIEVDLGTNLRFRPEASVTFETYSTLAFSRGVLEAVLPHHGSEHVARLEGALELERLTGSATQPSSFLAVVHSARSQDPDVAVATVSAWVAATVATVRALMLENLDVVELITGESLALARTRLSDAEVALEGYRAEAGPEALRKRIEGKDGSVVELERGLLELERDLAGRTAERDALLDLRASGGADVSVVLMDASEVVIGIDGAIGSLDARIEAFTSQHERVSRQLIETLEGRANLALMLADATVGMAARERDVREARQALDALAAIDPNLAYVAQVAPSGVRVLNEATTPTQPEARRAGLAAVLAAVVIAFAGVVLALLAEAVRAPDGRRDARTRQRAAPPTSPNA